jgi:hypothetical protein
MVERLAIFLDPAKVNRNILIRFLKKKDLAVSLAHICIQLEDKAIFIEPFLMNWENSVGAEKEGC